MSALKKISLSREFVISNWEHVIFDLLFVLDSVRIFNQLFRSKFEYSIILLNLGFELYWDSILVRTRQMYLTW